MKKNKKRLILNLYQKKQTKKGVRIRYKIRARKRAQVILSNIYYPIYIIQIILYKLYYTS